MDRVEPRLGKHSFSCPHCGALAHQSWFCLYALPFDQDKPPTIPDTSILVDIDTDDDLTEGRKAKLHEYFSKVLQRQLFLDKNHSTVYVEHRLANCVTSCCFSCQGMSIWLHEKLIYPINGFVVAPAKDMPDDVKPDFEEASQIALSSPRAAAALLRLCVQKICIYLGGSGQNINSDIGHLVLKGLNPDIQQALDIVRVVGNNAVHPGLMDLRDDTATATNLLHLVNLIVETQITQKRRIAEMFAKLPSNARAGIDQRDKNKRL